MRPGRSLIPAAAERPHDRPMSFAREPLMQTAAQTTLQAAVHSAFRMGSRPAAAVPSAESSAAFSTAFSNIAPLPLNEVARLQLLRDLRILDTPREPAFDAITRRAA